MSDVRFINTKKGPVVATARPGIIAGKPVEIYSVMDSFSQPEDPFGQFQVTLEVYFEEPVTLLVRGYGEFVTPFSNTNGALFFSPSFEYFPNLEETHPLGFFPIDSFSPDEITISGVLSLDPEVRASPREITLTAFFYDRSGGPGGASEGVLKLVAMVGDHTGITTLSDFR